MNFVKRLTEARQQYKSHDSQTVTVQFASLFVSHIPNLLFSVSRQTAK